MTALATMLSACAVAVIGSACGGSSSGPSTPTTPSTPATSPVTLSPASLSFTGLTSDAQTVTLTNAGSAVLVISSVVPSGNFTETDNCVGSLAVAASCTISVTFARLTSSASASTGAITITDDATGSPHTVVLTGPGVGDPSGILSPGSLTFGSQTVGTSSAAQTVTLTNAINGFSAVLTITSITTGGDFAIAQNSCGASLAPGASCTIGVTFTPTGAGSRVGSLAVFDNAPARQQAIVLTGIGQ